MFTLAALVLYAVGRRVQKRRAKYDPDRLVARINRAAATLKQAAHRK